MRPDTVGREHRKEIAMNISNTKTPRESRMRMGSRGPCFALWAVLLLAALAAAGCGTGSDTTTVIHETSTVAGPAGATGATGAAGDTGDSGATGAQGEKGAKGTDEGTTIVVTPLTVKP